MKKLLLLSALLLLPAVSFSASITWTSVLQDNRSYDSDFFSYASKNLVTAFAQVDYSEATYNKTTNFPVVYSEPMGLSFDMHNDGIWLSGQDGFFKNLDRFEGGDYSTFLSSNEGNYQFHLDGVPDSTVSLTVPKGSFDENFEFVDPFISNGTVSWSAVNHANKYRVRLYGLLDDGRIDWQEQLGESGLINETTYDLTSMSGWNPTKDLVLTVDAREYIDSDDWGSILVNRSRYYTVVEAAAPVPEPATFILLGSGLAGLAFYRRKRK